jgi:hypothetical protein
MKNFALFVFNGDPMCFIHVLLNALGMKAKGSEEKIIIEGASVKLVPCDIGAAHGSISFDF